MVIGRGAFGSRAASEFGESIDRVDLSLRDEYHEGHNAVKCISLWLVVANACGSEESPVLISQYRIGLVAMLLTTACMSPVPIDKLYGEYVAEYAYGTDTIRLEKGGVYSQVVKITSTGEIMNNSGQWSFDPGENRVDLEGCFYPDDGAGNLRRDYKVRNAGGCSYPVEREYGFGPWLRLGPDEGSPHRKTK